MDGGKGLLTCKSPLLKGKCTKRDWRRGKLSVLNQQGLKAKINHREIAWWQRGMQNPLDASDSTQRSDMCGRLGSHLRNAGYSGHGGILTKEEVVSEPGSLPFHRLLLVMKRSIFCYDYFQWQLPLF